VNSNKLGYLFETSLIFLFFFLLIFFWWYWGVNSGPQAYWAGALPLKSCPQPFIFALANFLNRTLLFCLGSALEHDPFICAYHVMGVVGM
jgi:hypothetical protein